MATNDKYLYNAQYHIKVLKTYSTTQHKLTSSNVRGLLGGGKNCTISVLHDPNLW